MIDQLKEQIKLVAEARQKAQQALAAKIASLKEWEETNKQLLFNVFLTAQFVNDYEAMLRVLTLQAYAETGNKTPALGVSVREVTKLSYNLQEALNWAIEHKMALKLDTPAFEKIAKASPLPLVTVSQEPQATIASDLNKCLELRGAIGEGVE